MEKESLIGRWIKCTKDDAYFTDHKIGDYIQLLRKNGTYYESNTKSSTYGFLWAYPHENFEINGFELMPEGFNPNNINSVELTSLPEKWCVKGTKCKTVQKFFLTYKDNKIDDFVSHFSYEDYYFHNYKNKYDNYCSATKDYIEITFDQFKKWVLKSNPIEIDEYLTQSQLIKGEIYSHYETDKSPRKLIGMYDYGYEWSNYVTFTNFSRSGHLSASVYFKRATFSERQWLEVCIKTNKFIPKEEALKSNKRYDISYLKGKSNYVIRCTKSEQVDKLNELGIGSPSGSVISSYKDVIIYCDKSGFDNIKDLKSNQTMIEYDDIIFDDVKPGINNQSFKVSIDKDSWNQDFVKASLKALIGEEKTALDYLTEYSKCPPIDSRQYNWDVVGKTYRAYIDPYQAVKSNDLEFQQPVIIKNKNKKSKLIIINQ